MGHLVRAALPSRPSPGEDLFGQDLVRLYLGKMYPSHPYPPPHPVRIYPQSPMDRRTDTCENITFPRTYVVGNYLFTSIVGILFDKY